jgi:hypothetical protein
VSSGWILASVSGQAIAAPGLVRIAWRIERVARLGAVLEFTSSAHGASRRPRRMAQVADESRHPRVAPAVAIVQAREPAT